MYKKISAYAKFDLKNIMVEYQSGKTLCLSECENINETISQNSVLYCCNIPGYKAEIDLSSVKDNMYCLSVKFNPEKDLTDKILKVTTLKFSINYTERTLMYINHRFNEGINHVADLEEKIFCKNVLSFYNDNDTENAMTISLKIPAKFKSAIEVTKKDNIVNIDASTTVPYTFEGEIICQAWNIFVGMSTEKAILESVQSDVENNNFENHKFENPVGWSTWDYYFTSATEDDVKENVDFIAADEVLSKKVRYIALDDGWQQREGDWKSGCRYPSGLKSLVDYIKEKGFEAGIWVAPTRLHFLCGTVMRRNDFLVRDKYGDPIKDEDMYILDPTHPDGEKFIRETFTYLAECGFTFYKLDFISNMVNLAQRFYDKTAGHFDVLEKLFSIVRDVVPAGSHIMGCSLPYGIRPGVADSKRTAWDIHNTWSHINFCTGAYIPQFASGNRLYRNDLDYMLVRGEDTTDDTKTNVIFDKAEYWKANPSTKYIWRTGKDFNYAEAKTWCTILLAAGSSVFMGDCMPKLNEKGIDLVRKTILESDFVSATPVFGDEKIPSVWYKEELSKLYIINFTNEPKSFCINLNNINLKSGTYVDVFSGNEFVTTGEILLTLDPHASYALKLK